MCDEKFSRKMKTFDEIPPEKRRKLDQEDKTEIMKKKSDNWDSPKEQRWRDNTMAITIRNSLYRREDAIEGRGLAIKPLQKMEWKEKAHHRKDKKRKEMRLHGSHAAEGRKNSRVKGGCTYELPKRYWEEQSKAWQQWKRQKRRETAWGNSRRERVPVEQLEPKREWQQKTIERQKEQKEGQRRADKCHKERDPGTQVSAHDGTRGEDFRSKVKVSDWSPRPLHRKRERSEQGVGRNPVKVEKVADRDPLSDSKDISNRKRKASSADASSTAEPVAGYEEGGKESSRGDFHKEEEEEEERGICSDQVSEQSAEAVSEGEMGENQEQGNRKRVLVESRFDQDLGEAEEDLGEGTPRSSARVEGEFFRYWPSFSPPLEQKWKLPKYLQGCRRVEEFEFLNRIQEGTYGVVYRAKDRKTNEIVAVKRLKHELDCFPVTFLREIYTNLKVQHPNIISVREMLVGSKMDKIYIVMDYMDYDLRSLLDTMKQPFLPGEVKTLMIQLLRGVKHLHDNWILHRDLKTSNLLLNHAGILKIADFGLAREYSFPLQAYTPMMVTLWYRAPELLLMAEKYSTAIDMWSVGCIFGELLIGKPLFPGKSELHQIQKVFQGLGTPNEKIWPGYNDLPLVKKMTFKEHGHYNLRQRFGALLSDQGFDLLNKFLTYYPRQRIDAGDALEHEYFRETPLPIHLAGSQVVPGE